MTYTIVFVFFMFIQFVLPFILIVWPKAYIEIPAFVSPMLHIVYVCEVIIPKILMNFLWLIYRTQCDYLRSELNEDSFVLGMWNRLMGDIDMFCFFLHNVSITFIVISYYLLSLINLRKKG
ncbi:hypothetical protein ACJX0J_040559 [Zea mays]